MPNFAFYGVRKQGTTKRYFSFWIWIWPLGIQRQGGSPTFDKVSWNDYVGNWQERKFSFEATFSLPARLKVPNQSMLERCLGPSSHLQVPFSQAKWSFFSFFFFALILTLAKVVSAGRECDPLKVETVHLLIQLVQTKPQRTAKDRKRICRGT